MSFNEDGTLPCPCGRFAWMSGFPANKDGKIIMMQRISCECGRHTEFHSQPYDDYREWYRKYEPNNKCLYKIIPFKFRNTCEHIYALVDWIKARFVRL